MQGTVEVLFVCLGNICRSPTAQGVFEHRLAQSELAGQVLADSAGTHAYHIGKSPDPRARQAALERGVDISGQKARQVHSKDFEQYHYILAMDQSNHDDLLSICPPGARSRVLLYLEFAPGLRLREVPDPYFGGPNGFQQVLDLVELAADGLIEDIRHRLSN